MRLQVFFRLVEQVPVFAFIPPSELVLLVVGGLGWFGFCYVGVFVLLFLVFGFLVFMRGMILTSSSIHQVVPFYGLGLTHSSAVFFHLATVRIVQISAAWGKIHQRDATH